MRARLLAVACAATAVGLFAMGATADPHDGPQICPATETAITGSYSSLTITGNMYVPRFQTLNVTGSLDIAPGACLDAFTLGTVHVGRDIRVGEGAILALGCTPYSIGPGMAPCYNDTTKDTVGGSIVARSALTMYLDGDTVGGNIISDGGGPGVTYNPYINFPIKDNVVHGNIRVTAWHGAWAGIIRNQVGGSVWFSRNLSANPDGNEVVTNVVAGNMTCAGDSPAAQFGDSGGSPNTVGGTNTGCP